MIIVNFAIEMRFEFEFYFECVARIGMVAVSATNARLMSHQWGHLFELFTVYVTIAVDVWNVGERTVRHLIDSNRITNQQNDVSSSRIDCVLIAAYQTFWRRFRSGVSMLKKKHNTHYYLGDGFLPQQMDGIVSGFDKIRICRYHGPVHIIGKKPHVAT